MRNREAKQRFKEKIGKKKKDFLLWVKSKKYAQRIEEKETTSEPCILAPTQPRLKINDLLNVAPDTGKRKFRSQTTLRWGIVIEDPV